jgi:hypothetical protein
MSPARRQPAGCALVLGLALLAASGRASAAPDKADSHFQRGVDAYREGDYAGALVEFRRAYTLEPKYQVLYNVAESYFQLQDYANALRTFQQYLYEGGNKISAKRRKAVDGDIQKLRRRVAVITVEAKEAGTTIAVDDVPVGRTPLEEPVLVSAGRRRITATVAGRPPVTRVVDVAGGDAPTITLDVPASEVKVVTLERPSIAPPAIAWGATGLVLTAAVVTGVAALGASGDLKDKLAAFPGDSRAIASAHAKTAGLALATDLLSLTTLAGAGAAIALTIKVARTPPHAVERSAPPSAEVVVRPTGLALGATF